MSTATARHTRRYAEGSRQEGELSVTEAAKELGLHPVTVRRHALEAITYAEAQAEAERDGVAIGMPTPKLPTARRDLCGRMWIPRSAIGTFRAVAASALVL